MIAVLLVKAGCIVSSETLSQAGLILTFRARGWKSGRSRQCVSGGEMEENGKLWPAMLLNRFEIFFSVGLSRQEQSLIGV